MLRTIEGTLVEKHPTRVLIEREGMGLELMVPLPTYHALPDTGQAVKLFTHLHVREDSWQLFGFAAREERDLFELLLTVSGVGPKLSLTVLSGIGVHEFRESVIRGNTAALQAIVGIGRKTAERLVVELREKLAVGWIQEADREGLPSQISRELLDDSLNALVSLGYTKQAALKAVKKVLAEDGAASDLESLIRSALKNV